MTEHTPTPWHSLPGDRRHQAMIMAIGEDGLPMAIGGFGMAGSQAVENTANVEFVVRAVNAFDALVEALEDCEWASTPDTDYNGDFCPFCYVTSRPHQPHCSRAVALALARGDSEVRA